MTGLLLALFGCDYGTPEFRLNTEGPDRGRASRTQRGEIAGLVEQLFGTPDEPRAPRGASLHLERLQRAAGPIRSDEQGTHWGLYRRHCAVCHGIAGDGAGPAAIVLAPFPHDFRQGVFKFTSTAGGMKAVAGDLARTLRRGMPGTSMPSFARLADDEIDALVEYTRYLSLRGETELYLFQRIVQEDDYIAGPGEVLDEAVEPLAGLWEMAESFVVEPPPAPPMETAEQRAESFERGRQLYATDRARCVSCHGHQGRGDGEQAGTLYDDWNRAKRGATPEQTRELARHFRLPLQRLRPRDFTQGWFKGGREPIDVYWRLHVGIKGTPMPGAGPGPGTQGVLPPEEIWHLVHYVRALGGTKAP